MKTKFTKWDLVKIALLITFGVIGIILGIFAKRPAMLLIPAFLLGLAYRVYNKHGET